MVGETAMAPLMAKKRDNVFLIEWQQIAQAQGEPDTSPEGLKRTQQQKELFANGISAALRQAGKYLSKRRRKRLWRALREFRASYLPPVSLITTNMVMRRAIELFRNSNAFLSKIESQYREATGYPPGSTIQIRLPVDYAVSPYNYVVPTDLER